VGFRWFVVRSARDLDVRGTVRNRADGAVEAVLQAPDPEALEQMLERLRQGPPAARVEDVSVEPIVPAREYDGMSVVR